MKHTASLFINDKRISEAYKKKFSEMQENGTVGQEHSCIIEEKQVKFWLPDDVRTQYKALIDGECFLYSSLYSSEDNTFNLRMRLWELIKKHMLVDGKEGFKLDDVLFTVDFIEQAITIYLLEVLFPLYHRSCTKVETLLTESLKDYMSESQNDLDQLQT